MKRAEWGAVAERPATTAADARRAEAIAEAERAERHRRMSAAERRREAAAQMDQLVRGLLAVANVAEPPPGALRLEGLGTPLTELADDGQTILVVEGHVVRGPDGARLYQWQTKTPETERRTPADHVAREIRRLRRDQAIQAESRGRIPDDVRALVRPAAVGAQYIPRSVHTPDPTLSGD